MCAKSIVYANGTVGSAGETRVGRQEMPSHTSSAGRVIQVATSGTRTQAFFTTSVVYSVVTVVDAFIAKSIVVVAVETTRVIATFAVSSFDIDSVINVAR